MTEKEISSYEKAIEELNYEYRCIKNSREYLLGRKIERLLSYIKSFDISGLWKKIAHNKKIKNADKIYSDIRQTNDEHLKYTSESIGETTKKLVTVYMCIVGKYDVPQSPLILMNDHKYILFTDNKDVKYDGWETREIPQSLKGNTANYINRYIKLHPWEFFDTKYTVYADGNVRFLTGVTSYLSKSNVKTGVAMFSHPNRDCLYREADVCLYLGKGNAEAIRTQIAKYREEGMPRNYGLKEATIIVCDLENPMCKLVMSKWWDEFNSSNSNRDQLSLPYVLWKNNCEISDIGDLGNNIRNDLKLQIGYHKKSNN